MAPAGSIDQHSAPIDLTANALQGDGYGEAFMGKSITVIGAGLVGRGWAIVFARAGHTVQLFDVTSEKIADALRGYRK